MALRRSTRPSFTYRRGREVVSDRTNTRTPPGSTGFVVNNTDPDSGSHVAVDKCDRVWFVNPKFGLRIFDAVGSLLASWNMGGSESNWLFDILLLPNYVLMVTYRQGKTIVHYDPQLTCG